MSLVHLFSVWEEMCAALHRAKHVMLLSDFDGMLTPIVERPELAVLGEDLRGPLEVLARHRRFSVGVVSGRALGDLKNRLGISGIIYAGNHGLEIEGPGVSFVNPLAEEIRPVLRIMHRALTRSLSTIRGALVEDKGLTLSVHYRQVEANKTGDVKSVFERVWPFHGPWARCE